MIRYGIGATLLGADGVSDDGRAGIVPVKMTPEDVSVRDARAFIASTPLVTVSNGNYVHCKLINPAQADHNLMVTNRRFTNTSSSVLGYLAYADPVATPSTQGVLPNRKLGGAAPTATFWYEQNTDATFLGGSTGSVEAIPANGIVAQRYVLVSIPPGHSLGFTVAGVGGPINGGNVAIVLEFYEEDV